MHDGSPKGSTNLVTLQDVSPGFTSIIFKDSRIGLSGDEPRSSECILAIFFVIIAGNRRGAPVRRVLPIQ